MAHGQHDGGVLAGRGQLGQAAQAVFALGLGGVDPGVVHVDLGVVAPQGAHDVDHLGVAQVGAVFLEGQAQHQHLGAQHGQALAQHELDGFVGHVGGHAVVQTPAGQDDLGVVADLLCLVGEVVRIDADAVAAHQAGTEGQKVPLGAGGLQHLQRVDAQAVEDQAQLVHQGDVDVALGVFDHLGGLGHADRAGLVRAGGDDLGVELVDGLGHFGGAAAGHLFDAGQAVLFVAGVDALGAVAAEEVLVELEAAGALELGHADFFGGAGVDGGFVDHHVAGLEGGADGLAGLDEGGQVGAIGRVDRGGHGDDEDLAAVELGRVVAVAQLAGGAQLVGAAFQRVVAPALQLGHAGGVDVEAQHGALFAEFDRQRQADVAQADNGQGRGEEVHAFGESGGCCGWQRLGFCCFYFDSWRRLPVGRNRLIL